MGLKETRRGQAVPKVRCRLSLGCSLGEDQTFSRAPKALATCGFSADPAGAAGGMLWGVDSGVGHEKKIPCDFPGGSLKELVRRMLGT